MEVAERHQANSYFYCSPHNLVKDHFKLEIQPAVIVFKENYYYPFECKSVFTFTHTPRKYV